MSDSLIKALHENAEKRAEEKKSFSMEEYIDKVKARPGIAGGAHRRVYDMIRSYGVKVDPESGEETYLFFERELFGIESSLSEVMEYFKGAALGSDVSKRFLLLYGPPSSGKSNLVSMIKDAMEDWSRTEEGAVYAIEGCPMNEEPLHAVPKEMRPRVSKELGVVIEGELCPACAMRLRNEYGGDFMKFMARRIYFSQQARMGVGTFAPSDAKCVVGETILASSEGLLNFDEMQDKFNAPEDEFVNAGIVVSGIKGPERASKFYNGGVKKCVRIRTRLGISIEGSTNHPVMCFEDGKFQWKKLSEVGKGDFVVSQFGGDIWGSKIDLPALKTRIGNGPNKKLTIPSVMTVDLATFLGYVVSEGAICDDGVWFSNQDIRLIEDYERCVRSIFGIKPHRYLPRAGKSTYDVMVSSKDLVAWMSNGLGMGRGAANKEIPACIRSAPKDFVMAFVTSLSWGDGTIGCQGAKLCNRYGYASASDKLARQLQMVLLNAGIVASYYEAKVKYQEEYRDAYYVQVTGDSVIDLVSLMSGLRDKSLVGLVSKTGKTNILLMPEMAKDVRKVLNKVKKSGAYKHGSQYSVKFIKYSRAATDADWPRRMCRSTMKSFVKDVSPYVTESDLKPFNDVLEHDNFMYLEVIETENIGRRQVYDLMVPETHSFCANGIICHNSQDISELVGSVDLSKIGEYGTESDPRAYKFDGELNISNRGVMEFIEILKCITPDSYVSTGNGLLRIEEIRDMYASDDAVKPGRGVKINMSVKGLGGRIEEASLLIPRGSGHTRKITTKKGYVIEGAPDHRVQAMSEGWKELKDLKKGDRVCINLSGLWPEKVPSLVEYAAKTGNLPSALTPAMSRLIGYYVADGSFLPGGIGISAPNKEISDDLRRISYEVGTLIHGERSQWKFVNVNLAKLFRSLGFGQKATNKSVPRVVRMATKELCSEFLRGYFSGAGTVKMGHGISCTTTSLRLAKEIQLLLLNYGIVAKRDKGSNKRYHTVQINDATSVGIFAREIGFSVSYKQAAVEKLAARMDLLPGESGLFFDEVASSTSGEGELWDFNVPVGNAYVANGLVNHNCDQKFLYVLLTATQEKVIKTPRFPLMSCDQVILAHTNESEYREFVGNPKNEALIDRMIVCRIPYNLRVKDETRIYEKLMRNGDLSGVHVAPHTLRVASMFAVLSRLEEPKDQTLDKVKKMKLYNEEEVEGFSLKDIPRIMKEHSGTEGMDGVSPRYVINRLVATVIRGAEEEEDKDKVEGADFVEKKRHVRFITPIHILRSLKEGLSTSSKFKPEERTRYEDLISVVRKEFDEIAKNEVQKAFFVSFEDEAKTLLDNYIDNVEAYMEKSKLEDPITKEEVEPSEQLMRAIETKIGIGEGAKDSFRNEILRKVAAATRRGEKFRYDSHGRLREAIEKQLFEDRKDLIKMTITSRTKRDQDELKRINQVVQTLCDKHGYIPESANELLKYVSSIMMREK